MSGTNDHSDRSESGSGVDTNQGNWLVRNFWLLKGLLAAVALVALGFGSLAAFDHEMANVLWAMAITMAALVVLVEVVIGTFQIARST